MLFNSLRFLIIFMPVVLLGAFALRGQALLLWICVASAVFYAFAGHAWFLAPMAVTTVLDYWVGRRLEHTGGVRRKALLILSLTGNLGLLAYFKYSGLIVQSANEIASLLGVELSSHFATTIRVILPAGISFYTFQTMSYVVDIYRRHGHAERNFLAYLAFVAFFPHLVAGPLTRHDQLIPQLRRISQEGVRPQWWRGVSLFSIGLAKKVLIADRIGALVDLAAADIEHLGALACWLVAIGYAMQIYFDFSGYSDMAIGLGRLFGIELPQNFNSPYKALDPSDFWRRWHITLSLWLRDYLYISLGGNRRSALRVRVNLLATMILGGLWHGANWTFAVWGLYHGILLVLYRYAGEAWDRIQPRLRQGVTFALVCVGWVFFRAPTMLHAVHWLEGMAGMRGLLAFHVYSSRLCVMVGLALCIAWFMPNAYEVDLDSMSRPRRAALGFVTAAAVIMMNYSSKFLYFQF
jgi:alginate O-acetyltransferase complex protein AlgI